MNSPLFTIHYSLLTPSPVQKKKLNKVQKQSVLAILSVGCPRSTAAKYVGVAPSTLRRILHDEKKFKAEVEKAEEESELFYLGRIRKAAEKEQYWRAAAWALERRIPKRYAPKKSSGYSEEKVRQVIEEMTEIVLDTIDDDEQQQKLMLQIENLVNEQQ
jgi:5-carboxymethyl-2-hydroxymuconate isomerase